MKVYEVTHEIKEELNTFKMVRLSRGNGVIMLLTLYVGTGGL
jgi:hypothetical protein